MAGDWIPWTKGLTRKQEVLHIAKAVGQHRRWVAATLMEFWEWWDAEFTDGMARGRTLDDLQGIIPEADLRFWHAVMDVGWLRVLSNGLSIPHYERCLGQSAKKRLKAAQRQRVSRLKCDKNVTPCSVLFSDDSEGIRNGGAGENLKGIAPTEPPTPRVLPQGDSFDAFFAAWPSGYRQDKLPAQREWRGLNPPRELAAEIIAAVERWKCSARWQAGRVMSPARWLRERQWENEAPAKALTGRVITQESPQQRTARKEREQREAQDAAAVTPQQRQLFVETLKNIGRES